MGELARANLRFHSRRYVATLLAVGIAVAFVAASLVFGGALSKGIKQQVAGSYEGAAAVITQTSFDDYDSTLMTQAAQTVATVPGVTEVYPVVQTGFERNDGSGTSWITVSLLGGEKLHRPVLESGSLPEAPGEAVVTGATAERLDLQPGSSIELMDGYGEPFTLQITGVTKSERTATSMASADLLVTQAELASLEPEAASYQILVAGEQEKLPQEQQEALVAEIEQALGAATDSVQVETGTQAVEDALKAIGTDQAALTMMLLLFPVIAATVAMIVVGTTFQVIFRQRERELALLRVIGATGGQVRRLMMMESFAVGVIGSVVGAAVGILGGAGIAAAAGVVNSYGAALSSVSATQIVIVVLLGTALTALAGYRPALRASTVPPVAALSGGVQTVTQMSRKQKLVGVIAGVITLVLGVVTAMSAFAPGDTEEKMSRFPMVLLGAVLTVAALIVLLAAALPLITSSLKGAGTSVSYRLAAANTARNPGRTAATGVAVFIGVALISMVTLGAQSLRVTAAKELDSSAPVDIIVSSSTGFTSTELEALTSIEGVAASAVTAGASAELTVASGPSAGSQSSGVLVEDEGLSAVTRGANPELEDGQILVPADLADEGETVNVCVQDSCAELVVGEPTGVTGLDRFVVTAATAESFGADLQPTRVWLKLSDPQDYPDVVSSIQELGPSLQLDGSVAIRASIDQIINVLVMVVVALLAVSVLVALVGIANTLSLSVAERTRENGLLRALGMTKRQVKSMLSWEALLIGVSATALGLVAGAYFGAVGFASLPLGLDDYVISVPWLQWLAVVVVAVLAAWLASVVPGNRAAGVSPVEALASE